MKAKFNFYSIKEFGFFKRSKKEAEFGNLNDFLDDFSSWLSKQDSIENTLVENKANSSKVNGNLYCEDFYECEETKNCLITLWNEVSNDEGNVFAMSKSNKIGEGKISSTLGGENQIVGLPSYYWIIPEKNLLITINFTFSYQATQAIENYFKGYANSSCGFINHIAPEKAKGFTDGYKNASWFRFKVERVLNKHQREKILRNPEKVKSLVRRFSINKTASDHRSKTLRSLTNLGQNFANLMKSGWINKEHDNNGFTNEIENTVNSAGSYKVEIETPFAAGEEVLEFMVSEFDKNFDESKWEKVGFKLRSEGTIWLGNTVIKNETKLNLAPRNSQLPSATEIMEAINEKRKEILSALEETDIEILRQAC